MNVEIHAYRVGNWGPSRLGVQVTLTDAAGSEVETFERQSATSRGGSDKTITERLGQDLVQKIVDET